MLTANHSQEKVGIDFVYIRVYRTAQRFGVSRANYTERKTLLYMFSLKTDARQIEAEQLRFVLLLYAILHFFEFFFSSVVDLVWFGLYTYHIGDVHIRQQLWNGSQIFVDRC